MEAILIDPCSEKVIQALYSLAEQNNRTVSEQAIFILDEYFALQDKGDSPSTSSPNWPNCTP